MLQLDSERRTETRLAIRRPCKLFDPGAGRYVRGDTVNISPGSMLIRFDCSLPLEPGTHIQVGIAQHRRHALLRFDDMVDAEVIRAGRLNGMTMVAVRFAPGQHAVSYLGHRLAA